MAERSKAQHELDQAARSGAHQAAGPGKRALTDGLSSPAAAAVRHGTTGGGVTLPDGLRSSFERSLGAGLGDVRLHTGAAAAEAASAVDARAFASGTDICFGAGEYAPDSPRGQHLLAHEVAHTVQQQGAAGLQLASTVSSAGDASEVDADRAADAMVAGRPASVAAAPRHIARSGAEEHRNQGNEAAQGANMAVIQLETEPLHPLEFGDIVMLGGDVYGSPEEVYKLSNTVPGRRELAWARWWARKKVWRDHDGWREPQCEETVKQKVRDQYDRLAGDNVSHFSKGPRSGPGPLAAAGSYEGDHANAITHAFLLGAFEDEDDRRIATISEGFAQHYLSDMFSAGHVRTPRAEIEEHYAKVLPRSGLRMVRMMAKRLLNWLDQHDTAAISLVRVAPIGNVQKLVEDEIYDMGGVKLQNYELPDLISEALHEKDAEALEVVSPRDPAGQLVSGGHHWVAYGDNRTPKGFPGHRMAVAAMQASLGDLERARLMGQARKGQIDAATTAGAISDTLRPFVALSYAPEADPASKYNVNMEWHWGAWNDAMRAAIDHVIMDEIVPEMRALKPKDKDLKVATLHISDAFAAMADEIAMLQHRWLILAMKTGID